MKSVTDMRLFRRVDLIIQVLFYAVVLVFGAIGSLLARDAKAVLLVWMIMLLPIGAWHLISFGLLWWGERGLTPARRRYAWLLLGWIGLSGLFTVVLPRTGFGWDVPYLFLVCCGFGIGVYYHWLTWREWWALRRENVAA